MNRNHLLTFGFVLTTLVVLVALRLFMTEPVSHKDLADLPTLMVRPSSLMSVPEETITPAAVELAELVSAIFGPETDTPTATDMPLVAIASSAATPQFVAMATPVPTHEPLIAIPPVSQVPEQFVIRFDPGATAQERADYLASIGGTVVQEIAALDTVVVNVSGEFDETSLPQFVTQSEPDYYISALDDGSISDPYYSEQWALPVINAPAAWLELPDDAPMITVAVIDSGICADHEDLQGRILAGWDFVQDDSTPQDEFGHGCGVAGIIAANIDNDMGIAGVAPNAQIMPLRVLDGSGIGTYSDVAAAIVHAADNGAQVINLSLGGPNPSSVLESAVNYAVERDVLVIAAAGNTGSELLYPARYESVIAVGSVDPDLQRSTFSSYLPSLDLLAPGRNILTTSINGGYTIMTGTSFAAPQVSAAAALEVTFGRMLSVDGGIVLVSSSEVMIEPTATSNLDC